jgi:hypothetical protein
VPRQPVQRLRHRNIRLELPPDPARFVARSTEQLAKTTPLSWISAPAGVCASWSDLFFVPARTRHAEARAREGLDRATVRTQGQTMCTRRAALRPRSSSVKFRWLLRCSSRTSLARERAGAHRPEEYPERHDLAKITVAEAIAGELHSPVNLTRGDWALDRRRQLVRTVASVNILWPRQFRCQRGS